MVNAANWSAIRVIVISGTESCVARCGTFATAQVIVWRGAGQCYFRVKDIRDFGEDLVPRRTERYSASGQFVTLLWHLHR